MERQSSAEAPLVVVVGPTASGKTSLAIEIARLVGGEIICADSRTVYKYTDIGTAKPSHSEQASIPHWGLDLVEPGQRFTAADFKAYADQKIREIRSRGNVPFLVGGTGLYVDAVLYNFSFSGGFLPERRERLNGLTIDELIQECYKNNISLPENERNKRHLVRAIERNGKVSARGNVDKDTIVVGIACDKQVLQERIAERTRLQFANGVVGEARHLGEQFGWDTEALKGNVYRIVRSYLNNDMTLEEAIDAAAAADRQLAKRQMTWFKRNPLIAWHDYGAAKKYLYSRLVKT